MHSVIKASYVNRTANLKKKPKEFTKHCMES